MTPQERIQQLLEQGAAYGIRNENVGESMAFVLGGVQWPRPGVMRWCAIFPEHQGHVHEAKFDRLTLEANGRDVALWQGERLASYVCPIDDGFLESDGPLASFAKWRHQLSLYNNKTNLDRFMTNAI